MVELWHHLLLGAAVAALLGAGMRVGSGFAPDGLARALSAVVVAASAAVIHALLLGAVSLGSDPWALTAAALGTWVAARALLPEPKVRLTDEVPDRWERLPPPGRFAVGAGLGVGVAWAVWLLRYPGFGWDGITYHVPEIVAWVQSGNPGAIVDVLPSWPVGNYPLVNEVLLAWSAGISRGFAFMTVWTAALVAVLAASTWLGLRELSVPRLPAGLAVAALCCAPVLTNFQLNGPSTDLPALAWLACCAGLCAAAWRRGRWELLAPALMAAGLSVGTKTTTLALTTLVLTLTFASAGRSVRRIRVPLALAAGGALVVGGYWYARNTALHGSPFWPLITAPWGSSQPHAVGLLTDTFLDAPGRTLERFGERDYVRGTFAGSALALLLALLAPFVARRRAVTAGAVVTLLSLLAWMNSPATGLSELPGGTGATYSTVRYLLPGLAAAILTLALAAREPEWRGRAAEAALAVVLVAHVIQLFDLGYPAVPSPLTPLAGAAVGGLAALALSSRLIAPHVRVSRPAAALAVVALAALLSTQSHGLVERHARIKFFDSGLVRFFSGPAADGRPIWMTPHMVGVLAGDRLERSVEAMPAGTSCDAVRQRATRGWVVVSAFDVEPPFGPGNVAECVRRWKPIFFDLGSAVYGPTSVGRPRRRRSSG